MALIELNHLTKTFVTKSQTVDALKDISLSIDKGDIYGIIGMSGAGKSTLVRCINYLERPTSGDVIIDGKNLSKLSDSELRQLRQQVSMIFQHFNLLQQRDVRGNIAFASEAQNLLGLCERILPFPPGHCGHRPCPGHQSQDYPV